MNHYTGNITPGKDIIFVFGSNPEGKHGAGSAKVALQKFGAKYGKGDGLHGQSYALITTEMRKGWPRITLGQITDNVRRLYEVARKMPDKKFMVAYRNQPYQKTLCGYTGAQLMKCFLMAGDIPENIWFSEEWYYAIGVSPEKEIYTYLSHFSVETKLYSFIWNTDLNFNIYVKEQEKGYGVFVGNHLRYCVNDREVANRICDILNNEVKWFIIQKFPAQPSKDPA